MKILYVTTISLTINSFFKPHIEMLVNEGHKVDIACNSEDLELDSIYYQLGCKHYQVDFSRSPICSENVKAYCQLKRIMQQGHYDIVHCHTPNASLITRLVCRNFRKSGLKVFYTAHGFHFYKGAPKLNWMLFYPIEKFCSFFTDKLITINKEDFDFAKNKLKAKDVYYVPGVGIDLPKLESVDIDIAEKRREIGVPEDALLLLSVGELNENKNHQIIIKALAKLKNPDLHYAIAGLGDKSEFLLDLSRELGVEEQVHLLGYRTDIIELNRSADAFCFPSVREGLSVSLMEAMACGCACVVSKIRGNVDLIDETGGRLFEPSDLDNCIEAIDTIIRCDRAKMGKSNIEKVKSFEIAVVIEMMRKIYFENV